MYYRVRALLAEVFFIIRLSRNRMAAGEKTPLEDLEFISAVQRRGVPDIQNYASSDDCSSCVDIIVPLAPINVREPGRPALRIPLERIRFLIGAGSNQSVADSNKVVDGARRVGFNGRNKNFIEKTQRMCII